MQQPGQKQVNPNQKQFNENRHHPKKVLQKLRGPLSQEKACRRYAKRIEFNFWRIAWHVLDNQPGKFNISGHVKKLEQLSKKQSFTES